MKYSEARVLVIEEWDRWIRTRSIDSGGPTGKDSLIFFFELQDNRSILLDFPSRGRDKWEIIHAWLLSEERVSDRWISPAPPIVPGRKPSPAQEKPGDKPGGKPAAKPRGRRVGRHKV